MNGRLLRSALQDEGGPAQQRKIEDQAHPMFRDQGLDHIEQQGRVRFRVIEMKHGGVLQRQSLTERVGHPFAHRERFLAECHSTIRTTQRPKRVSAEVMRAHSWIVTAVYLAVVIVPIHLIEATPGRRVLQRRRALAGEQAGCPTAVVRLQTQFVLVIGQFLELC